MNYVFISPNFPHSCTLFCDRLHQCGVNVLGVGDAPYDILSAQAAGCHTAAVSYTQIEKAKFLSIAEPEGWIDELADLLNSKQFKMR